MNRRLWRIYKPKHASHAFDGEGARLYGGRWNSIGTAMIYTASSISLAILELMVNLESESLLARYNMSFTDLDEQLIVTLDPGELPADWRSEPPSIYTREIGDRWAREKSSVALAVPSVVVPEEENVLLNPDHPDFEKLSIGPPREYFFNPRIAAGRRQLKKANLPKTYISDTGIKLDAPKDD